MTLVWVSTICLVLAFFHSAVAREFVVGGRHGWVVPSGVEPETYNQWAGRNRFLINDTLLFNYNPAEDSVLHVTAPHYDACNTSSPIASYKGGKTLFRLPRKGPFHFISGNRSNCQKGEKLIVTVLAQGKISHGASAPTVASPGPSVVAPSPSFAGVPAPAPAPSPKVASSSPSPAPAPVAPLSSPSSASSPSPAPAPVAPLSSPSSASSPSPATVVPVPSPSSSPTPVVPVSSPASSSPSASVSAPTSSPSPPPSASPPPLISGLNLVMPLLFLAFKTLATNY